MLDFSIEDFATVLKGQEKLFDATIEVFNDPIIRKALSQFAKGVAVTLGLAVVRHGYYQIMEYRKLTKQAN